MNAPLNIALTCAHASVDIRAFVCSNGSVQYVKQCLVCGEKVGNPIKKAEAIQARGAVEFILPFDEHLREIGRQTYERQCQVEREAKRAADIAQHQQQRDADQAEFDAWYEQYLGSQQWRERRAKVIRRANGICEGCLEARAVVVHHTTYQHVGNELLFELVALCHPCHERAHLVRSGAEA